MDKVIITVPDYVVCVIGILIILLIIKTCMDIYFDHLERKLKQMERTTTSTVSIHTPCTTIIGIMKAIGGAEDTIWHNDGTTVFEMLWGLYLDYGGDESDLEEEFPENA